MCGKVYHKKVKNKINQYYALTFKKIQSSIEDMDKDIQRKILESIRNNGGQISVGYLGSILKSKVLEKTKAGIDPETHNLQLLLGQKKVEYVNSDRGSVQLTYIGWQEFNPWYVKAWSFFTTDMAKILSILATLLSIASMVLTFLK